MIRIGIIGAESKHSEFFASLLNSGEFPDICCSGICYNDCPERADYVQKYSGINIFFDSEKSLIMESDAVMICYRDGEKHMESALMCAAAGKPFFVDKPFSITAADAEKIIKASTDAGIPMMGGSTLAFDPQIYLAQQAIPKAFGLWISYAADPCGAYHGYHFYGSHLTDILLSLISRLPLSIRAMNNSGAVAAVLNYPNGFQTVLQSNPNFTVPAITVLSAKGSESFHLNDKTCYANGLTAFINMIKSGKPPVPYEKYILSVRCVNAIIESMNSEKTIFF